MFNHRNLFAFVTVLFCLSSSVFAQQNVTLLFDNTGAEIGVTTPGTTSFSFMGSSWSGGIVETVGSPPLYASGAYSYEVQGGSAMVVFDPPVTNVNFFYVHGNGFPPGTATARATNGTIVDTGDSDQVTTFGDPDHFLDFDEDLPIASITFTGGVIDNFSYTTTAGPAEFNFNMAEGAWLNRDTDGEGILFDFGPSLNLLFGAWFTFTLQPADPGNPPPMDIGFNGQRWMTSLMAINGNTASGPLRARQGGEFDSPPTASETGVVVGQISVEFLLCDLAQVDYMIDSAGVSGSFQIEPLEKVVNPNGFSCI